MEIILIAVSVGVYVFCAWAFYQYGKEVGYEEREKIFQDNPISFQIAGKPALWVGRESGIVKVKIYDKKLVEIISDPAGKEE